MPFFFRYVLLPVSPSNISVVGGPFLVGDTWYYHCTVSSQHDPSTQGDARGPWLSHLAWADVKSGALPKLSRSASCNLHNRVLRCT